VSYATERDAFGRTPQDLVVIGVRECQNGYASGASPQGITRSEEFDHADWTKVSVSVSADDATAPDGFDTADTVTFNATNDAIYQQTSLAARTPRSYTGSIFLRIAAGTETVTIRVRNHLSTENTDKQVTITTTWTRFFVQHKFVGGPGNDVVFEVIRLVGDDATDLEMWGANVSRQDSLDDESPYPYVKRVDDTVYATNCTAADAGDGSRCWYSRPSCQDPDNFNAGNDYEATPALRGIREFKFCRKDAPLALPGENVAPLLDRFDLAGQEVDPGRGVTVNERVRFTFVDDAGPGLWNPLQSKIGKLVNTATGGGTFWRRFLAIYRNYTNPKGYLIRKVGFVESGAAESDYQQRGRYLMANITIRGDDRVTIECTDRLKIHRKDLPAKISDTNTLQTSMSVGTTTMYLADVGEISSLAWNAAETTPDYKVTLEIDYDNAGSEEKVNVTAIDLDANTCTVQRARWGTTAVKHDADAKVREIVEFGTERTDPIGVPMGKNPLDIIQELYLYAGIDSDDIDTTAFQTEITNWLESSVDPDTGKQSGVLFRRTLTKRKKVEDLVKEIRELVMLLVWIDEDQKLTCKLFAPPLPTETLTVLTDDSNLVDGTIEIDDSDETRLTRGLLAWDLAAGEDGDKPEDFDQVQVHIFLDEEEDPYYGEQRARLILSEWLRDTDQDNPALLISRIVSRFRYGARIFNLSLEIKDDAVKVGSAVQIETDKIQKFDGTCDPRVAIVTRKKRKSGGTFDIEATEMGFARVMFWAPDGLPDYTAATTANKRSGYYTDDQGLVGSPKELGYFWW
jgi:hypothetical protein